MSLHCATLQVAKELAHNVNGSCLSLPFVSKRVNVSLQVRQSGVRKLACNSGLLATWLPFPCVNVIPTTLSSEFVSTPHKQVILVLFAFIEKDRDPVFATVLFWIGAPTSLLLSIIWVGSWVALKKEIEHVNASWMLMPVASELGAGEGSRDLRGRRPEQGREENNGRGTCAKKWSALRHAHRGSHMPLLPADFVSAAVGPMLDTHYRDAMQFW